MRQRDADGLTGGDGERPGRRVRSRAVRYLLALAVGLAVVPAAAGLEITVDGQRYRLEGEFLLSPIPVGDAPPPVATGPAPADPPPPRAADAVPPRAADAAPPRAEAVEPAPGRRLTGRAGLQAPSGPETAATPAGEVVNRTENELAILNAVAPFLRYDDPGPDVVAVGDGKWFGLADLKTNPQYADQPGVYGSLVDANRAWGAAGWPKDGGLAWMPGVHVMKNMGPENFARDAKRIRAQDKTRETVVECDQGWQRFDFCLAHGTEGVQTFEGFTIRNAYGRSRRANIGGSSQADKPIVLIDMTLEAGDNGIRTTGRWVAMFRTKLLGNARTNVAHGAYLSNDNGRRKHTPFVIAVDTISTGNVVAHAFKTRAGVVYIKGGTFESANGFCIDGTEGGAILIEDITCIKPPGVQGIAIAHGLDKANAQRHGDKPPGAPAGKYTNANLCAWVTRKDPLANLYPAAAAVPKGKITLRNVHFINKRGKDDRGRDRPISVWGHPWNGSKPDQPMLCRPPYEAINVTSEGGPLYFWGDWQKQG